MKWKLISPLCPSSKSRTLVTSPRASSKTRAMTMCISNTKIHPVACSGTLQGVSSWSGPRPSTSQFRSRCLPRRPRSHITHLSTLPVVSWRATRLSASTTAQRPPRLTQFRSPWRRLRAPSPVVPARHSAISDGRRRPRTQACWETTCPCTGPCWWAPCLTSPRPEASTHPKRHRRRIPDAPQLNTTEKITRTLKRDGSTSVNFLVCWVLFVWSIKLGLNLNFLLRGSDQIYLDWSRATLRVIDIRIFQFILCYFILPCHNLWKTWRWMLKPH